MTRIFIENNELDLTQALSQQVVEDYNLNTAMLGNLNIQKHLI